MFFDFLYKMKISENKKATSVAIPIYADESWHSIIVDKNKWYNVYFSRSLFLGVELIVSSARYMVLYIFSRQYETHNLFFRTDHLKLQLAK